MADTTGSTSSKRWTSTQAYMLAVVCLLAGFGVGYLLRGSAGGGGKAPESATVGTEQPQGMPPGMGQEQMPTPEQRNAMFNRGIAKWQGKMDVKGAVADWELLLKVNPTYEEADKVKMYIAQAKK